MNSNHSTGHRDRVVLGEGVALSLRPAPFGVRILSFLIDALVILCFLFGAVFGISFFTADQLNEAARAALAVIVSVLAFVGYPVICEQVFSGRSLGRLALGTRVVRDDGGPVQLRQSILRSIAGVGELWITTGAIALVTSMIDRRSRRLGDMLAGTYVIQERMAIRRANPLTVPASLQVWAATADLGHLPDPLVHEIRGFLPRAAKIHPESRRRLGRDLVQQALPYVAPPPPPGTNPELFLTALLAERTRRDILRLHKRSERLDEINKRLGNLPFINPSSPHHRSTPAAPRT
ncbi:RDD family protein [Devriesea agamarum]|uniref:RDD family protein n=1 Tax=Devriesea agamarum TaxID=472569 RepID=UPI00071E2E40|nr:RDD family protein [Devriesea agamarum]